MVPWRGWCLPEVTSERFCGKWAVLARAEMDLGDVSAPQTAVRAIWGARGFFYGKGGLISPTLINAPFSPTSGSFLQIHDLCVSKEVLHNDGSLRRFWGQRLFLGIYHFPYQYHVLLGPIRL